MRSTGGRRASQLVQAVLTRRHRPPATVLTAADLPGLPVHWGTALERFAHSVHRYHDRVEVIPDRVLRRELQAAGELLDQALAAVRASGRPRDAAAGDPARMTRDVLRAGTLCAHALESAVAAAQARRGGDLAQASQSLTEVHALAAEVAQLVGVPPR